MVVRAYMHARDGRVVCCAAWECRKPTHDCPVCKQWRFNQEHLAYLQQHSEWGR